MPLQTDVQLDIIIYAILSGILIGIIFDFYRVFRGANIPKTIIFIQDFLFWIFAALLVFTFLLYTNYAFLGPYVYVFMGISLLLHMRFISPLLLNFQKKCIKSLMKIVRVLYKNFIYPFKVIYNIISGKSKQHKKISWIKCF